MNVYAKKTPIKKCSFAYPTRWKQVNAYKLLLWFLLEAA